jgi:hypothetical protein
LDAERACRPRSHSPLLPTMQSEAMTFGLIERVAIAMDDLEALDSI